MFLRILIVLLFLYNYGFACKVDPELVQLTIDVAKQEGIQPELLIAVVWVESRFCPDAVSPAGAIGLGQLMPGTAKELEVNPQNPSENMIGASKYLLKQFTRFEDWTLALAAYNAGARRVSEANGIPEIIETKDYVKKVIYTYNQFSQRQLDHK